MLRVHGDILGVESALRIRVLVGPDSIINLKAPDPRSQTAPELRLTT